MDPERTKRFSNAECLRECCGCDCCDCTLLNADLWNRWVRRGIVRWILMLGGIVWNDRAAGCLQIVRARDVGCCSESFVLLRAVGCYESFVRRAAMLWEREFSTNRSRTRGVTFLSERCARMDSDPESFYLHCAMYKRRSLTRMRSRGIG